MNSTLSHELIVEILLRLPVKSLLRFKCVCKSWLSLISDPRFAKSHFDLAAAPTYRVLLKSGYGSSIQSMDIEASFHDDSAVSDLHIPHPSDAYVSNFRILGYCRGFIAFDYDAGDVMLWNPSTGVHKHIPYYHVDYMHKFLYGFGYDASTDDYLIIIKAHETNYYSYPDCSMQIWGTRFEFFSLKTNSWNKLEGIDFPDVGGNFQNRSTGSFLNGALHWLALSVDKKHFDAIIAFDLIERSLSEIPMPHDLTMGIENETNKLGLSVMERCLCLGYSDDRHEVAEIWIMKEYKVQSSWIKTNVVSTCDTPGKFFSPKCFTKSGGIIGTSGFGGLLKFNDKGELLEYRNYDKGFYLDGIPCVVCRESLLSLPNELG
ncbi:hypothetical protein VNO77_21417 [Canavalia gladiata]|uniref:F-box domain-containing protein n=1 Tax=Canavalia gladiata TaxID=3824 RepID=A0AAN9LR95_CANGL